MRALSFQEVQRAARGEWLVRPQAPGSVTSVVTDSREAGPGSLFVALPGQHADGHDFVADAFSRGAGGALVTRPLEGVPEGVAVIRVQDTVAALGELARYYRSLVAVTVVAITGSNGKTTTKEMVAHLLRSDASVVKAPKSFNNFVGLPLTIFGIEPGTKLVVVELGTSAPVRSADWPPSPNPTSASSPTSDPPTWRVWAVSPAWPRPRPNSWVSWGRKARRCSTGTTTGVGGLPPRRQAKW